jgi:hypothetical protein
MEILSAFRDCSLVDVKLHFSNGLTIVDGAACTSV